MYIEIYKENIRKYTNILECINNGCYIIRTNDTIRKMFNFAKGDTKYFIEYIKNNQMCIFINLDNKKVYNTKSVINIDEIIDLLTRHGEYKQALKP